MCVYLRHTDTDCMANLISSMRFLRYSFRNSSSTADITSMNSALSFSAFLSSAYIKKNYFNFINYITLIFNYFNLMFINIIFHFNKYILYHIM